MPGSCDGALLQGFIIPNNLLIILSFFILAILGPRRGVEILEMNDSALNPQGVILAAQVKSHKIKIERPRTSQGTEP
jgi:hypothetical protein